MKVWHSIDIGAYPDILFNQRTYLQVSDDYFQSTNPDIGPDTLIERLPSYPGFEGPVIHVVIGGPPAGSESMQHAHIGTERVRGRQLPGDWGYEVSVKVLKAPTNLSRSVWDVPGGKGLVVSLASLLMHPSADPQQFYAFGGVQLVDRLIGGKRKYFISTYTVYHGNLDPDPRMIPFEIGKKQRLRIEVYYDPDNDDRPTVRGFLQTIDDEGRASDWKYIGKKVVTDLEERKWPIEGDITWVGAYVSRGVERDGYEIVAGEAVVYRK